MSSILVPSVAIRPSHFLFRRIWTLLTVEASLSDSQQTRQDKQRETEHFIQITAQALDGWNDNAVVRHFERIVLVKHPHLERSYSVFWDYLFHLNLLSPDWLFVNRCKCNGPLHLQESDLSLTEEHYIIFTK